MRSIVWVALEYDNDKKVETEIFIHNINDQTITLETYFDAFGDDVIKSFKRNIKAWINNWKVWI